MAKERTLSILKPDTVQKNIIGKIEAQIENIGLSIIATKMLRISRVQAGDFYNIHKEKSFYDDLINFMTSGPVVVQVLEGENAIAKYREIIGVTAFGKAAPGTIRAQHATSITINAVHGSDSADHAAREINFFFSEHEIFSRASLVE